MFIFIYKLGIFFNAYAYFCVSLYTIAEFDAFAYLYAFCASNKYASYCCILIDRKEEAS